MTTDLATWLLKQIAEDRRRAYQGLLGYPVTAEDLAEDFARLEPALLTSEWTFSYHEVFQRMTQKPSPEWLERRQSIAAAGIVYQWDKREKVADCGPANVYPARHIATWDPARVLVECAAKRRIIELHAAEPGQHPDFCGVDLQELPCSTQRALALPYAEHPGYLEAWRP